MLAKAFPNLEWLKKQANTSFADRKGLSGEKLPTTGWPNVIMNARGSRVVRDDIQGPLSIFSNRSGESVITVGKKRVTLNPGVFFISNDKEHYTLEIGQKQAETSNIHFGHSFMQEAFQSMTDDPAELLDQPLQEVPSFHNRVVQASSPFLQLMESLISPGNSRTEEERQLFDLLSLLVVDETRLRRRQDKVSALRTSTKEEIMKRLLRVTDYLYTSEDSQPDLDELARVSCLSKFHFLRLFKITFGQTPHQFISDMKIERAQALLKSTSTDVKQIASSLGFRDSSTFSRLFHQKTGVYPSQYRSL